MSEPSQNTTEYANEAVAPPSAEKPMLALPAPSDDQHVKLEVNGQSFSLFDKMGPTVVNSDGTLSRIADWAEKTPAERANILRVLGKRNMLRLDQKKAELGIKEDGEAGSTSAEPSAQ
ncbi:hypothetical protein JCM10908_002596 [Rhodotorula pacifica]|uniref:uncharacterized protein n=1 Tax=Rhodotorula pacifica TaxID=1495444 RepID=UPI00317292A8